MTGPEHYAEAERILATLKPGSVVKADEAMANAAIAQAHSTLALAAATALSPIRDMTQREWPAWVAVAATKQDSHIGETQEAGRSATVNETPAGARNPESGASSLRTDEEGGAVGTRVDRLSFGCDHDACRTSARVIVRSLGAPRPLFFCTLHAQERGLIG